MLHDAFSTHIVRPSGRALQSLRRSERRSQTAYRAGLRFRAQSAAWPAERREAWMLQQLRRTCRWAYATTDYYRERWDAIGFDPRAEFGFDDFARLPVLTREELQTQGERLKSRGVPGHELQWNATGGSTGQPVHLWMGPEERGWRASGMELAMRRVGAPPGARQALLWGHHLDPVQRDRLRDRVADFLVNRRWYDCLRLSPDVLTAYDRDLRGYAPRFIVAYASALASLAEHLERTGAPRPSYPSRCAVTGAEKLFPTQREQITRVFQCPVHERYGSRDVGGIGFQFQTDGTLAFDVDWAWVLVEPDREAGEAALLVTKLHGDGTPMIRYENGDMAIFPAEARPGRPAYRLLEVTGRRLDRIMLPSGRWVHGAHFPHLMKDFPVSDFQVVQRADYSVTVRYVPSTAFADGHLQNLRANLAANLPGVELQVEPVATIPRTRANKWRPVISEVQS